MIRVSLFLHVRNLRSGKVSLMPFAYDMKSEATLPAVLRDIDRRLAERGEERRG